MYPIFPVVYRPDEPPAGGAAPDAAQTDTDSSAATDAAPAAQESPPSTPAPWSADLEAAFPDQATRAQVDAYLREKVQPHVTQLEQATAENRNANKLWEDFEQTPVETFVTVASELFGNDVSSAIVNVLRGEGTEEEEELVASLPEGVDEDLDDARANLSEDDQDLLEWAADKRREEVFNTEFDRVKESHPDVEFDRDMFLPFVVSADGNFDVAAQGYAKWIERFGSKTEIPENLVPDPPPTLGGEIPSAGSAASPQEKHYESIDEAIDDFFDEQKSPPPTVGSA